MEQTEQLENMVLEEKIKDFAKKTAKVLAFPIAGFLPAEVQNKIYGRDTAYWTSFLSKFEEGVAGYGLMLLGFVGEGGPLATIAGLAAMGDAFLTGLYMTHNAESVGTIPSEAIHATSKSLKRKFSRTLLQDRVSEMENIYNSLEIDTSQIQAYPNKDGFHSADGEVKVSLNIGDETKTYSLKFGVKLPQVYDWHDSVIFKNDSVFGIKSRYENSEIHCSDDTLGESVSRFFSNTWKKFREKIFVKDQPDLSEPEPSNISTENRDAFIEDGYEENISFDQDNNLVASYKKDDHEIFFPMIEEEGSNGLSANYYVDRPGLPADLHAYGLGLADISCLMKALCDKIAQQGTDESRQELIENWKYLEKTADHLIENSSCRIIDEPTLFDQYGYDHLCIELGVKSDELFGEEREVHYHVEGKLDKSRTKIRNIEADQMCSLRFAGSVNESCDLVQNYAQATMLALHFQNRLFKRVNKLLKGKYVGHYTGNPIEGEVAEEINLSS